MHHGKYQMNVSTTETSVTKRRLPNNSSRDLRNTRRRFQLQRCFKRWRKITFGHISPFIARDFYKRRLLYRCLLTWEEKYLPNQREWKLMIRAEYHERYCIWRSCFKKWLDFVSMSKQYSVQKIMAKEHEDKLLKKRYFSAWIKFVSMKHTKKERKKTAEIFFQEYKLKRCWSVWQSKMLLQNQLKKMNVIALSHWANNIKQKTFERWHQEYVCHEKVKTKMQYCARYHDMKVKLLIVTQWSKYILYRREKKKEKEMALNIWIRNRQQYCLSQWKEALFLRVRTLELNQIIYHQGQLVQKRRFMQYWKKYVSCKKLSSEKKIKAKKFYEKYLKRRYLQVLMKFNKAEKVHRKYQEKALSFYKTKKTNHFFCKWKIKLEAVEDGKLISLFTYASEIYNGKIIKDSLRCWSNYVKYRKKRKREIAKADLFHHSKIYPRYFQLWICYKDHQKLQLELKKDAFDFQQNLMLAKYFYSWLKIYKTIINIGEYQKNAIDHYNLNLTMKIFSLWKQSASVKMRINSLTVLAIHFREKHVLYNTLMVWKKKHSEKLKWSEKESVASLFHQRILLKHSFASIKKYKNLMKLKKSRQQVAHQYYCKKLKNMVLNNLKIYVRERRQIYEKVTMQVEKQNKLLKIWALTIWQENVVDSKRFQLKLEFAQRYYNEKLLKKSLKSFQMYTSLNANKRYSQDEKLFRAQIKLEKSLKLHIFHKWKNLAKEEEALKIKMTSAALHHQSKLLSYSFLHLKCYVFVRKKKLLQRRSCEILKNKFIQRRFLHRWKQELEEQLVDRKNTHRALWWWSYNLQKKILRSWSHYKNEQKRKNMEYEEAMQIYRSSILDYGITKWMQIAMNKIEERKKMTLQFELKEKEKQRNLVHKYAMIWLTKSNMRNDRKHETEKKSFMTATHPSYNSNIISTKVGEDIKYEQRPFINEQRPSFHDYLTRSDSNERWFIPVVRKREKPRNPEYLRESFDLSLLLDNKSFDNIASRKSLVSVDQSNIEPRKALVSFDQSNIEPRKSFVSVDQSNIEPRKSFVSVDQSNIEPRKEIVPNNQSVRYLQAENLEVTNETDITIGYKEKVQTLLPPSSFQKVV